MPRPQPGGPSIPALITNWREYDAPAHVKLRLAARNLALRFARRGNCCGHDGEPGC